MTAGPSSQIPGTPPEGTKQAPASLNYCAAATLTRLVVWPVGYGRFLASAAPANKIAHWLTVNGFTLWVVSLIAFYAILTARAEYSITLKICLGWFEFVLEVLWFLASLG